MLVTSDLQPELSQSSVRTTMAEGGEEESEVFEITDFTTASEWERFVARIEEVINEWKLANLAPGPPLLKGELSTGEWEDRSEVVTFADVRFGMTLHRLKEKQQVQTPGDMEEEDCQPQAIQDLLAMENDFPPRAHCLCRWFGVRSFVVLAPGGHSDSIQSESKASLLLSSISIAVNNTGCSVPVFVQTQQKWRRMYQGVCEGGGLRTNYDMVHLKRIPPQYDHLAGLLDVFKSKIACPLPALPPVTVSVRFTYILSDWTQSAWTQEPPDFDIPYGGNVGGAEFGKLPFGALEDPVSELHLSTTWPCLSEEMIVDNSVYSDLDPLQAPQWSVRVRMTDNPQCLLGDYLSEFVKICHSLESTDQLLGGLVLDDDDKDPSRDVSAALQRLTEPSPLPLPTISDVVSNMKTRTKFRRKEAPIGGELLNMILQFLFPDAALEGFPRAEKPSTEQGGEKQDTAEYKETYRQYKSSPEGSLVYQLALCMCVVNSNHGGLRAVAHLWQEFVLEMRYRWENNYSIPGLPEGSPDMSACLLLQKLQMLNCCIQRKTAREARMKEAANQQASAAAAVQDKPARGSTSAGSDGWDVEDSDEEFFECETEMEMETEENIASNSDADSAQNNTLPKGKVASNSQPSNDRTNMHKSESAVSFKDTVTSQPEGRLKQCGDLCLLDSSEPLYIPITQEPGPMTEDMLEQHAEVLAKLGTSAEGAHLRARMQSACLLSDMEAFKAANPACKLEDFVRWYSPRDWIEEPLTDETGQRVLKGELSPRMRIPGNMWCEVWDSARPVPARKQKRLFDDTKEAEKVLHFLAALRPAQVALQLTPMLVHAAILRVEEEGETSPPALATMLAQIQARASKVLRAPNMDAQKCEELVRQVTLVETVIARARSLRAKFNTEKARSDDGAQELERFVSSLLEQPEVKVIGAGRGPAGTVIHKLFATAQKAAHSFDDDDHSPSEHRAELDSCPDFPRPAGREYILRTTVPRPCPVSRPCPQRMFCTLIKEDFRLAGAFTSDTTFM
ncbi:rab3 GTPase-activating protein catalytic subunit-like isoform X2 [Branchiostoma floridae]|uniref:Rab3 GTPase-activating protein catalytic subunit n=1 Tax=Branchiostoma floridae TaxID=7739 RepID=A0A9J7HP39_BRAFL|nr:rab3 GTPase-activating protein catalytic subunit-like isoform X2 [Branchiostoma floridae]